VGVSGDGLVPVFLTVGVRTSAGPGPGVRRVSPDEASRIVAAKLGVMGETAPAGYDDGGSPAAIVAASKVFEGHALRPAERVASSN
jgi:hypothetical protein